MPVPVNEFPDVPLLNYDEARSQIRSGDILLCSGTSLFSNIIQKATGSIWSHVGFVIRADIIGRILLFESVESIGVRTVSLSHYAKNYDGQGKPYPGKMLIARHKDFDASKIPNASKKAVDLLGNQYNQNEIIRIAARIGWSKIFEGDSCKAPEPDNEYICSEYAYEWYSSMGVYINHDCRGFIAPADFAKTEEVNAVCGIA